ncbi:MAG: hypothetical protein SFX73_01645 [Kofleriaceae bacterium]|nr:hypothetical protein [Kofleriaceae bacterium]
MRRIYIHLIAIVIASVAAWLTWELVLKDQVEPRPTPPALGSSSSGSGSSYSGSSGSN